MPHGYPGIKIQRDDLWPPASIQRPTRNPGSQRLRLKEKTSTCWKMPTSWENFEENTTATPAVLSKISKKNVDLTRARKQAQQYHPTIYCQDHIRWTLKSMWYPATWTVPVISKTKSTHDDRFHLGRGHIHVSCVNINKSGHKKPVFRHSYGYVTMWEKASMVQNKEMWSSPGLEMVRPHGSLVFWLGFCKSNQQHHLPRRSNQYRPRGYSLEQHTSPQLGLGAPFQ